MRRLEGKVALISAPASTLGATLARAFVEHGANVVIGGVDDVGGGALAGSLGSAARYAHLDVTMESYWAEVTARTLQWFGHLDVLVNDASMAHYGPIEDTSLADLRRILDLTQIGSFLGMRAVVPAMQAAGRGSIVNISSIDGLRGVDGRTAFAATQWAMRGLTKSAAVELGHMGIRVNSVLVGPTSDPTDPDDSGPTASMLSRIPLHRVTDTTDVAAAVVLLASEESQQCTGTEIVVDGGTLAVSGVDPQRTVPGWGAGYRGKVDAAVASVLEHR